MTKGLKRYETCLGCQRTYEPAKQQRLQADAKGAAQAICGRCVDKVARAAAKERHRLQEEAWARKVAKQ